jgi:hypothetical protein
VGQGLPLWLPKGCIERKIRILEKSTKKAGYEQVITPHIENYMLPLAIMPNMEQIAFNQSLPHMKEKSFTKTDELPSSL